MHARTIMLRIVLIALNVQFCNSYYVHNIFSNTESAFRVRLREPEPSKEPAPYSNEVVAAWVCGRVVSAPAGGNAVPVVVELQSINGIRAGMLLQ